MGKQQSKEESVIIAQNASGGNNASSLEQMHQHTSAITYILGVICLILVAVFLFYAGRLYNKCHRGWIRREIQENNFRRSISWFRRRHESHGAPRTKEDQSDVRIV